MINSSELAGFSAEGWQRTEIKETVVQDEQTLVRTTTRTIYQGKVAVSADENDTTIDTRPVWCLRKTVYTETVSGGTVTTNVDVYYPDGKIAYRHRWDCRTQESESGQRLPDSFKWAYLS